MIELNPAPQIATLAWGIKSRVGSMVSKRTPRDDAMAGVVLGIESVPDGLAGAGVDPVYGLHAYMVGTSAGGPTTNSALMTMQATGAMAMSKTFEQALPEVTEETRNSVVIVRFRGMADLGSTLMEVLVGYASILKTTDSKLVVISVDATPLNQLAATGVTGVVGTENIHTSDKWLGRTVNRAWEEAEQWVRRDEAGADV